MSTIRVDNFGPSAGGTTYSARGIAKAWVNFDGTGTIAARDSENVSSLTDNGNGDFTITFSSGMNAADYSANIDHNGNGSLNASWMAHSIFSSAHSTTVAPTTSAYRFCTFHPGNLVNQDCTYNTSSAHGDLA